MVLLNLVCLDFRRLRFSNNLPLILFVKSKTRQRNCLKMFMNALKRFSLVLFVKLPYAE